MSNSVSPAVFTIFDTNIFTPDDPVAFFFLVVLTDSRTISLSDKQGMSLTVSA